MTLDMNKQQSLIIKAFAIIFVIMFHTKVFPCGGAIGVHLFLIVSGYGIYCSLEKERIITGEKESVQYIFHICFALLYFSF